MITVQENQEGTGGGGHHSESGIRKTIRDEFPSAIIGSDPANFSLRVSVKNAEVDITACFVDSPVIRISPKNVVNDKICEREEEGGNAIRMGNEFFTFEKGVEDKVGVREGSRWGKVGGGNRAGIWRPSLSNARNQGIII